MWVILPVARAKNVCGGEISEISILLIEFSLIVFSMPFNFSSNFRGPKTLILLILASSVSSSLRHNEQPLRFHHHQSSSSYSTTGCAWLRLPLRLRGDEGHAHEQGMQGDRAQESKMHPETEKGKPEATIALLRLSGGADVNFTMQGEHLHTGARDDAAREGDVAQASWQGVVRGEKSSGNQGLELADFGMKVAALHASLPSILAPPQSSKAMQEFAAQTMREIPFLDREEVIEGDHKYDEQLDANRRLRLGNPRRGAEHASGLASSKWKFIEGGIFGPQKGGVHLLAMHSQHKTALSFFHFTVDATCRFMPGRQGPAYLLFSDASCAQVVYWLPNNIIG
jgi:hypothetical protein